MTGKVKNKKSVVESLGGSNLLEDLKTEGGHLELIMPKKIVLPIICEEDSPATPQGIV